MQTFVDELVQQATDVGTIVNGRKTKELLIGSILKDPPISVSLWNAAGCHSCWEWALRVI